MPDGAAELERLVPGLMQAPLRPDPRDFRDKIYEPGLVRVPVSLRAPTNLAVRDQGEENSCTGQALAAAIDILNGHHRVAMAEEGRSQEEIDRLVPERVSERMLFESAKAHDEFEGAGLEGGSSLRGALKGFYHNGVCAQGLAPYNLRGERWVLTAERAKDARRVQLGAYRRLNQVLLDCHAALAETGVLVVSTRLHAGWAPDEVRNSGGRIAWSPLNPQLQGYHAVAVVGYDLEGFLVLNSFGASWGGFGGQPGVAHWSYADWRANAQDIWVLQLAVPAPDAFNYVGGAARRRVRQGLEPVTTPRLHVVGHYLHACHGKLVVEGSYPNWPETFTETARFLEANDYHHLLLWAESGLESVDDALARVARYIPILKANDICPLFVFWQPGFGPVTRAMLDAALPAIRKRGGDDEAAVQDGLARVARIFLKPLVNDLYRDIELTLQPARTEPRTSGARGVVRAALARIVQTVEKKNMKLHLVGDGIGSLLVHALMRAARRDARLKQPSTASDLGALHRRLGSVSLLSPLFAEDDLAPFPRDCRLAVHVLTVAAEQDQSLSPFRGPPARLIACIDSERASALALPVNHGPAFRKKLRRRGVTLHEHAENPTCNEDALNQLLRTILVAEPKVPFNETNLHD